MHEPVTIRKPKFKSHGLFPAYTDATDNASGHRRQRWLMIFLI